MRNSFKVVNPNDNTHELTLTNEAMNRVELILKDIPISCHLIERLIQLTWTKCDGWESGNEMDAGALSMTLQKAKNIVNELEEQKDYNILTASEMLIHGDKT